MKPAEGRGLERTRGTLHVAFACRGGRTVARETFQSGALKVRFPRPLENGPLEATVINTAGGLTGGDSLAVSVTVAEGAKAVASSQACEKIYRSAGGDARMRTEISVGAGGRLDWLPQPTILFDRAHLERDLIVDMDSEASILLLDSCILGRTAMREEVREGKVMDRWRIRRRGQLIYADTVKFEGPIAERYAAPWALGHRRAYASLLHVAPGAESRLDEARAHLATLGGRAAASAWNGLLSIRFVADDGYRLIGDLTHVLRGLRRAPLPRLWAV